MATLEDSRLAPQSALENNQSPVISVWVPMEKTQVALVLPTTVLSHVALAKVVPTNTDCNGWMGQRRGQCNQVRRHHLKILAKPLCHTTLVSLGGIGVCDTTHSATLESKSPWPRWLREPKPHLHMKLFIRTAREIFHTFFVFSYSFCGSEHLLHSRTFPYCF